MLESHISIESVLGAAWPGGAGLAGACAAAAVAAAGLTAWILRSRATPARSICQNLQRLAGDLQSDLRELQLVDTSGQLGAGWNRLITEVANARQELETAQIHRQAKETLNQYELKWLRQLLDQLPYGLITVADDWLITFANAAAERMMNVGQGELKGRRATEFFAQDLSHITPSAGMAIDRVSELTHAPKMVRVTAVDNADGAERSETALLLQDVTQEREREKERSHFLYHVTHELRTPLTNIRAYAETLSEGVLKDPDTLRECYNVIVSETQRLSRLVEDILSLSQMEGGAARIKMDDVNTARLIRQVVEDMQAQADAKRLELILTMPPKVPTIRGDKERLAVVLTNLVGNAIKYTPEGGKVEVLCSQEGSRMQIQVVDSGLGIAAEEQDRVFEKFYRSSDERVAGIPGTGLGLAMALEIVRTHGGAITLKSELGKGSTFNVVLPIGSLAAVQS